MNGKKILYIFIVCVIAFLVWAAGQAMLMFVFPESGMTASRVWVISVLAVACTWNCVHFYRVEKKQKEDEENENYKGVY